MLLVYKECLVYLYGDIGEFRYNGVVFVFDIFHDTFRDTRIGVVCWVTAIGSSLYSASSSDQLNKNFISTNKF